MCKFLKAVLVFGLLVSVSLPSSRSQTAPKISANLADKFHWTQWAESEGGNGKWYGFYRDWNAPMTYAQANALAAQTGVALVKFNDADENVHVLQSMVWDYFEVWIGDSLDVDGNASSIDWRGNIITHTPDSTLGAAAFVTTASPFELSPIFFSTNAPFRLSVGATNTIAFDFLSFATPAFQWRFNGEALPTQTAATLNLQMNSTNQSGLYELVIHTPYGSATSAPVQVTVFVPAPVSFVMTRASKDYLLFSFNIANDVDQMYLDYTADWKSWTSVPMPKVHGPVQHYEQMDPKAATRFYRLRRTP